MSDDVKPDTASSDDASPAREAAPTALQRAIRERAMARIQAELDQPRPSWRRRLTVAVLVLLTVVSLVVAIDFAVRAMHRILELWLSEPPVASQPAGLNPDQPFYISVDPPETDAGSGTTLDAGENGPR